MRRGRKRARDILREPGLVLAIECTGTLAKLAEICGCSVSVACQWRRLPEALVLPLALAGIPRWVTRPDLYAKPVGAKEWRLPELPRLHARASAPNHLSLREGYR
jgi:hypothetical protein